MADDDTKLVIAIEAKMNQLEKDMRKANGIINSEFGKIEARTRQAATRMESSMTTASLRMGTAMKGFALGMVGGMLSVGAAIQGAKGALDEFSKIQDKANSTGLDSEFFQELVYQADQGGVAFDQLSGSLEFFNKNSGLAVVGKGKMVAALKALNPELLRNIQLTTLQEQRVRLAADAIARAGNASEKAALSSALFGDSGAAMVEVFKGGSAEIDAMARKARDLGLIIDRDLIAKSEALGDELATATRIMDLEFKQTLIDLAPILISSARLAGDLASGIRTIADAMSGLSGKSARGLDEALSRAERSLAAAKKLENTPLMGGVAEKQIAASQAEVDSIRREMVRRALDKVRPELERSNAMFNGTTLGSKGDRIKPPVLPGDEDKPASSGASRNSAAAAALREAEAVRDLISNLEFEHALIGKSDLEREQMNALRQAGAAATDEQKAKIKELIDVMYRENAAGTAANDNLRQITGIGRDIAGGIAQDMQAGASATDILNNALGRLSNTLVNDLLDSIFAVKEAGSADSGGGGFLSGIIGWIGKLFGGGFAETGGGFKALLGYANGGDVHGAGTGTSDSIPTMLSDGEFVVNAEATSRNRGLLHAINDNRAPTLSSPVLASAQSTPDSIQNISINAPVTVNASGGTREENSDLAAQISGQFEATMRGVIVDELQQQLRNGNMLNTRSR